MPEEKTIFIACGQLTKREKYLGKKLENIVNRKPRLKAFLAESVHSFKSLNEEIFENLKVSNGFIAVIHDRNYRLGTITAKNNEEKVNKNPSPFGSLWINQEIGILAFRCHQINEQIPMRIYMEKGVKLEGIIKYSIANPIIFDKDNEVIENVTEWIQKQDFNYVCIRNININDKIELQKGYTGDLHTYRLSFEIENTGKKNIDNIQIELHFPKGIPVDKKVSLPGGQILGIDIAQKISSESDCDVYEKKILKLIPGKKLSPDFFFFQVNHEVYYNGLTERNIIWKIYADDMEPVEMSSKLEGPDRVNF